MNPTPEFNDAAREVTFKIAVNEGPQYRIGTVEFKGFSSDDAAILGRKWALKSGEVYDQTYANGFLRSGAGEIMSRIARDRQSQRKPLPNIRTEQKPNRQTLIVDLTIELKD